MSTPESPDTRELYEFGPFRVDAGKETLVRGSEIVPLTPKTFQLLLVLVRRSQEIVTKDDLMKEVWPDTFVEESNLSRNIFMLRKALGETPQDHRYILTVPGRGYRLAENVQLVPNQQVEIVAAEHSKIQVHIKESRTWPWIAGAVVLFAIAAISLRLFLPRSSVLTAKDTVVLADFINKTSDPVFDGTLRQGMAVQLAQSPFLSLVSDQRIGHTLRLMGRKPDAPMTSEVAREVCQRTGSAAFLEGSITPLGSQYVLGLRATNCHTGEVLDEQQVQAARKEDALNALSQIASNFRTRVGESLATIRKYSTPLVEATTPSLEALEAYSTGWRVVPTSSGTAALPFFKRAVEIDPNFAMAHASLGRMYADVDESDLAAASTTRAWQLREHTSEQERFFISAVYETLATGNLEAAQQTCDAWIQAYPREVRSLTMRGSAQRVRGRFENAAADARKAVEIDPDFAISYYGLAASQSYLGQLDEAERTLQRGRARGLEIDEFLMLDYDLAFLKRDESRMARVAAQALERTGGERWIFNKQAAAAAYFGHLQQARELSRRAVEQSKIERRENASQWQAAAAVREAWFGNAPAARADAAAALKLSKNRATQFGASLVLAIVGDNTKAQNLADDLEKRFPEDTMVRFSYLPAVRARLALNQQDAAKALELLQSAAPQELAVSRSAMDALFGALYPVYMRGEAFLAAHQGKEAAAEFQKILDHPAIMVADPIGALAHLQIARAYVLAGDQAKAKSAYHDFLTLWKDADPGIPVLQQAKAEYARLRSEPDSTK